MTIGARATVGEQLRQATAALAAAGVEPARVDAEWLLAGVLDVPRLSLYLALDRPLPGVALARYAEAVRRRTGREPLQRVLGWEAFRGELEAVFRATAVLTARPVFVVAMQTVFRSVEVMRGDVPRHG